MLDPGDLEAEHEALLSFLYLCPAGVVQTAADGAVRMINPHAAQLLIPLARSPAIDNLFTVLEHCAPDLRNMADDFADEQGHVCQGRRIVVGSSGPGPRVLSCTLLKVSADCLIAMFQDISHEVEQERQLRQNEALFASLVAGVNDFALFSLDAAGRIESWNRSGVRQTGFRKHEVLGKGLEALCYPGEDCAAHAAEQVLAAAREGWSLRESRCVRRGGDYYWCQILLAAVEGENGVTSGYSVVMRDVTERRMSAEELRRLLTTDHLTGAENRARFFERAEAEIQRCTRLDKPLSAIMLDVDHFKRINDTFGHGTGDAVLRHLVQSCRGRLREGDVLARLGGEEFALLLPGTDLSGAAFLAEHLRAAAAESLATVDGLPVGATVSLGCAEFGGAHGSIDSLLSDADAALYRAKRAGRDRVAIAEAPPTATVA